MAGFRVALIFILFTVCNIFGQMEHVSSQVNGEEGVSAIKKAERFFLERNYFMAEASLMGSSESEDLELKALLLVHTAQKLGNMEGKTEYYSGFLDQEPEQRQLALLFRAWIFAYRHDWSSFQGQAVSALLEVDAFPHHSDLVFLYCLARYTSQSKETLGLSPSRQAWFQALRETSEQQQYPLDFSDQGLPSFILRLPYLGTVSEAPSGGLPGSCDDVMDLLNAIDQHLLKGDLLAAAEAFNTTDKSSLQPFPWDFRINYYRLLARFFELNEEPERLKKIDDKIDKLKGEFQLNFDCFQDKVLSKLIVESGKTKIMVPKRIDSFEKLEEVLPFLNHDSFRKTLNALPSQTSYQQVYHHFLLGQFHLANGRFQTAYSFLSKAETSVVGKPFQVLESKVLTVLGDYYLREHNLEQANWYWLAAAQSLVLPETVSCLEDESDISAPFDRMIDAFLLKPMDNQVSAILYAHQMRELLECRVYAFGKGQMAENRVISNQILEIGQQIRDEIDNLKGKKSANGSSTFSNLRELWRQLWPKTRSKFQNLNPLNIREIQQNLGKREILLVFTEGTEQLGVVVIAPDRAFVSYLGPKKAFTGQLSVLVQQQLGKAIDFNQTHGLLCLSPSFRTEKFLDFLSERNPESSFQILFQLASMGPLWDPQELGQLVTLYDRNEVEPEKLAGLNIHNVESSLTTFFNQESVESLLKRNAFFFFNGSLKVNGMELILGEEPVVYSLNQILMQQQIGGVGLTVSGLNEIGPMFRETTFLSNLFQVPFIVLKGEPRKLILPSKIRLNGLLIY